jgi:tetratricopeptide (TPR) repeat protein
VLLLVAAPRAFAVGPLERNPPKVAEGLKAYDEGRYEEALQAFDAARAQMPDSAALEYDRGNTLYRLKRLDEAQKAYQRAAEMAPGQLKAKDLYNLGNNLAEMGRTDEAIAAYKQALLLEPGDAAARHNLEVLRRLKPPPPKSGGNRGSPDAGPDASSPDAGPPDAGRPDGGQGDGGTGDGGTDAGSKDSSKTGDGGPGDAGAGDGGAGADGRAGDGGPKPEQQPQPEEGQSGNRGEDAGVTPRDADGGVLELRDGGVVETGQLDRKDTERLLDALRQSEKNLQLWRFQQKKKQRKPNEKDW